MVDVAAGAYYQLDFGFYRFNCGVKPAYKHADVFPPPVGKRQLTACLLIGGVRGAVDRRVSGRVEIVVHMHSVYVVILYDFTHTVNNQRLRFAARGV